MDDEVWGQAVRNAGQDNPIQLPLRTELYT